MPRFGAAVHVNAQISPSSSGHLTVTGAGTQTSSSSNLHYQSTVQTVDVKPEHAFVEISNQMKQMVLRNEHLKTGRARINPTVSEMKKYDAHCDRVMYFCQVVDTFICDAFISPLKYPSDFFGQLASTATSEDSVEFRKRVQALGAPTGVTVEILLEWEQFFDDEYAGTSLPPITKAEFIAVGKAMIAFNQLTESSVSVLEKVFDVVYPNQM